MPKDAITTAISSPFMKALGTAFIIGVAWNRLEYKMDEVGNKLVKKIDEHIISDGFEKKIIQTKMEEMSASIEDLNAEISSLKNNSAFIRPDDIRVQNERRRNRQ